MGPQKSSLYIIVLATVVMSLLGTAALAAPPSAPVLQAASTNAPILLIVNSAAANKFGSYLGEILRAEGLNAFDQVELGGLTSAQLAQYDLAILAQTSLSSAQATMLTNYVSGGGALIAMRPDSQIAGLFGLSQNMGTLANGYLQISNAAAFNGSAPGFGLTSATLQIHGDADLFTTSANAVTIAQLYNDATTGTNYPAVVAANYVGGQASAFTYDLASNVVYTRQGNPANANIDVDGDTVTRTVDLFQTIGNPVAPWIDRNKIPIPQADEQQRLFARLAVQMAGRLHPLPQLWYLPGTAKTILVLTSDAHWNSMTDYTNLIADTNSHGGRITIFLSDRLVMSGNVWDWPSNTDSKTWQAQGNTLGLHPSRLSGATLASGFNDVESWFASTYTVPRSNTVRMHRVEWQGWTDGADVAAAHNIGMDCNFYHWGAWLQKPDGTWPHGYITGSGQPMKFMRADGTLVPEYQQLTELVDEQMVIGAGSAWERLNATQALTVSKSLIDSSLAGDYAALMTQFHVDYYTGDPRIWAQGTMDYARSKGVPIWNADQWLSFTQTRHDANYRNIAWNAGTKTLSFSVAMTATAGLKPTTILPLSYGGQSLQSVTVDGGRNAFSVQTIKGTKVAFVSIPAGNHSVSATYGGPTATPTNTNTPGPAPTATNTPLPPAATNTLTPTPTNTPLPPTLTRTPLPPTRTSTPLPPNSFVDTTAADFGAGSSDANIYLAQAADGELMLAPAVGVEFSGSTLPATWFATPWATGGSAMTSGGLLTVDGALTGANAYYGPGRSLEFVATFQANTSQHVGFGTDFNAAPWAIFSTGYPGGNTLRARTDSGSASTETDLGGGYLGAPHRYRIDWTASAVVYTVDGVQVASHSIAVTTNMRPVASDQAAGATLLLDWLGMSPYATPGTFVSRVFDPPLTHWLNLTWSGTQPTGTSVSFETRTGNTADPYYGTWSAWTAVSGGVIASPDSNYIQYRVTLASADTRTSPTVEQVVITYQR